MQVPRIIEVDDRWWTDIAQREKKVEGRKANPKWNSLQLGDVVAIQRKSDQRQCELQITDLRWYPTLFDFLLNEGLRIVLPGITTMEEAIAEYLKYSTVDEYRQFGVMAIELDDVC